MHMLWNDLRYAARVLRRDAGFTTAAVLSLALGIGANTAIFSLINTVMLRTLPVERPQELVELLQKYPGEPRGNGYYSRTIYEHFRDNNHVFSALTGTSFDNAARVRRDGGETETLVLENIVGNYFPTLGLKPAIGRLIGPGDADVVVLSWSYWDRRFQRDPAVLGNRIVVNDQPLTVIGVAPRPYVGPRVGSRTDLWMPQEKGEVAMLARLKSGVTLAQAEAEAQVLFQFAIQERTSRSKDPLLRQMKMEVEPASAGAANVRDRLGKPLLLVMAVVGLLLLLACINLASMLLARSAGRRREMAVRVALGASRGRILRQVLTESVLLSVAGALVGVLLAWFGTGLLVRILASGRLHDRVELRVEADLHVLLFTIGVTLATGFLFGLAPAWYAIRSAPAGSLRQSGRAGETRFWRWFGKGLVATQVGLSILLVTGAAVFLGHLSRLRNLDLGFRREHVLLVQLDPAGRGYSRAQLAALYRELLSRLEAIPGVRSASITACTPIQGCGMSRFVSVDGFVERPEDRRYTAFSLVAPRYFETLGIPLLAGRDLDFADAGRTRVAVASEAFARHYFSGRDPIGKLVTIENYDTHPYQIVGIAGDAKYIELREPAPRTVYLNMFQENRTVNQFAVRTSSDPYAVSAEVRRATREVLKTIPISRITTLSDQVDAAIVPERLIATLSEFFGALGAVLAGVGLYGLLAYAVARRINEIGIRMALGATAGDVRLLVLRDALATTGAGVVAGAVMVLWARPLAAAVLPDLKVDSFAPLALGAAAIFAIALLSSYLPIRRAARVDPMVALRHE
jgi:putative ABC transport system permease protein